MGQINMLLILANLGLIAAAAAADGTCPVQMNTDYPGNDIANNKTNSYQECRALCEVAAGCNAYTYNSGRKVCILKSSISRSSHVSNAVSGKPCKKSSCLVHLDTDYPGEE